VAGEGLGLVAAVPIGKGEKLLSIPSHLVVTPSEAAEQCALGVMLAAAGDRLPDWSVLAVWMVGIMQGAAGGEGKQWWQSYNAVLPERTNNVLEWSDEQVGMNSGKCGGN
jgi:hypothetical protein